jgi:hypothetical protein
MDSYNKMFLNRLIGKEMPVTEFTSDFAIKSRY